MSSSLQTIFSLRRPFYNLFLGLIEMSKKACYFKCKYEGQLYRFPPITYTSYDKYCKWKDILREEDKEKGDDFKTHNIRLCSNHFEKCYVTVNNRLTKNAVPTLKRGITIQQEELLCTFIEENPKVIMGNLSDPVLEKVKNKWRTIGPRLNALGPEKSYDAWAEYLLEVMSNLRTKEVIWVKETSTPEANIERIKNTDDFIDLELKILHLWHKGTMAEDLPDDFESDFIESGENEIAMEYIIEDGDSENSRVSWTSGDNETTNEIVTFTLNVATGGHKPLLQAADIAPYAAPQDYSNVKCKCKRTDMEVQDEFEAFGKDIAQQLRNMPTHTALETRKQLMSVLRSKQSKIINDSFLQY